MVAIGCGKSGDVAKNDTTQPASSSTSGSADKSGAQTGATGTTDTAPNAGAENPGSGPAKPDASKSSSSLGQSATPPNGPPQIPDAGRKAPPVPGSTPPTAAPAPTPEQLAAAKAHKAEVIANAAKADKAKKVVIPTVKGDYTLDVDDVISKLPPQLKSNAQFMAQVEEQKKKPPHIKIADDGSTSIDLAGQPVHGYTALVDGKPAIIIVNPDPKPNQAKKIFLPLVVSDGGKTITVSTGGQAAKFHRA